MLPKVLGTPKGFATDVTLARLQAWNVRAHMRGDVVALCLSVAALTPSTGEVEIVGRRVTNVMLTQVLLHLDQEI